MKMPFAVLLVLFSTSALFAQSAQLAKSTANDTAQKQPTLLVFSGSDWCKPCIQLKKEVIEQADFQSFIKDKIEVQIVDFPYRKANKLSKEQQAKNDALAEQFNPLGQFPYLVLIDEQGEFMANLVARDLATIVDQLKTELQ